MNTFFFNLVTSGVCNSFTSVVLITLNTDIKLIRLDITFFQIQSGSYLDCTY